MEIKEADEQAMEVLAGFDSSTAPLSEAHICDSLRPIRKALAQPDRTSRIWMEEMAFLYSEAGKRGESQWGTYFGPFMTGTNEQGQYESPSIKQVTPEIIDYWSTRAKESKHPVLRARYAGLVWDFGKRITGNAPDVAFAHIRIDAILEMVAWGRNEYDIDTIHKLEHALSLALSIRDVDRMKKTVEAITQFEEQVAEDDKPGLWGFSFELLVNNKSVQLEVEQEKKLVAGLEGRLERVSNPADEKGLNPWAAEKAALILARYYRKRNQTEESHRVLTKYGLAFEKMAATASATLSSSWFQQVARVFGEFGLKKEADELLKKVRALGRQIKNEMNEYSKEVTIKGEDVRKHIALVTAGDVHAAIARTVLWHIPTKEQVIDQLKNFAASAPLLYHIQHQVLDHHGRPVAVIGPITDDLDGHVVKQIAENIAFPVAAIFIRELMVALVEKYKLSTDSILDLLYESPLFHEEKRSILSLGIDAYLKADAITAIHLLVPQVEDGVRRLVELSGGSVIKFWRTGGFSLMTFDELLRHESVAAAFGEDAQLYLRVLFTDPRGLNLRNDVCHGNKRGVDLGMTLADRVIHSMLLLSLAREKKESSAENSSPGGAS